METLPRAGAQDAGKPLNARQQRFVEEYTIDMNAYRAAKRVGYSPSSSSCVNLLRRPQVKAAAERALAAKRERAEEAADQVVEELSRIAFANMLDYVRAEPGGRMELDLAALSRDSGAAISRLRVEYFPTPPGEASEGPRQVRRVSFALADKALALKTLARCLGVDTPRSKGRRVTYNIVTGVPRNRQEELELEWFRERHGFHGPSNHEPDRG